MAPPQTTTGLLHDSPNYNFFYETPDFNFVDIDTLESEDELDPDSLILAPSSSVIDLTSSPDMARRKRAASPQAPSKRQRLQSQTPRAGREQDEPAKTEDKTPKSRLANLQCNICLESPKDLTATVCGREFQD